MLTSYTFFVLVAFSIVAQSAEKVRSGTASKKIATVRQFGPSGLAVGQRCFHNSNCQSGSCAFGQCVCRSNFNCPPPFRCVTNHGVPYCDSGRKVGGATCSRGSECDSLNCISGVCTCFHKTVCPADAPCRYKGPSARCYPTNRPIGAACFAHDNCATGRCKGAFRKAKCVCQRDADCPPDHTCVHPPFGKTRCEPVLLMAGQSCRRGRQCRDGRCWLGKCRCLGDGACPGPQKCRRVDLGKNYCFVEYRKRSGERCKEHNECISGHCRRRFGRRRKCA